MPRRKTKNGFKKFATFARGASSVATAAFTAVKTATALAALINTEWKSRDITTSAQAVSNAGTVNVLSHMSQGSDDGERNGNSILPKKLSVRVNVFKDSGATNTILRAILLRDKEYNGADPAVTDILDTASYNSFMKLVDSTRFFILGDKTVLMDDSHRLQASIRFSIKMNKPKPGKKRWEHVRYLGTGSTAADRGNGQLILLLISDQATNTPTVDFVSRLRYIDN